MYNLAMARSPQISRVVLARKNAYKRNPSPPTHRNAAHFPSISTALPSLKAEIFKLLRKHHPDMAKAISRKDSLQLLSLLRLESQRRNTILNGFLGAKPTVYTDLNAYGVPLEIVRKISVDLERAVGNTHGTSDIAGISTHYLDQAQAGILGHFGASPSHYDIFVRGVGFTAAFDGYLSNARRHVQNTLLPPGKTLQDGAVAFTEYEHHSNSLPFQDWVRNPTQLPTGPDGTLDMPAFKGFLEAAAKRNAPYILATLSMQSNVTSVKTDIKAIEAIVKQFLTDNPSYKSKLLLSLDLAAFAPHGDLKLNELHRDAVGTPLVDAIAFSPYKLDGGQQGSGVALVRNTISGNTPVVKGGGTVDFVFSARTDGTQYAQHERYDLHNAGSPNVMGLVNSYLGLFFKDLLGTELIHQVESEYATFAYKELHGYENPQKNVRIKILGPADLEKRGNSFPFILQFKKDGEWYQAPQTLVSMALEQFMGIVTRAGCNCAGPYGAKLFGLDSGGRGKMAGQYFHGEGAPKEHLVVRPGWTRATLGPMLSRSEVKYFVWAWKTLADNFSKVVEHYRVNPLLGKFVPVEQNRSIPVNTAIDLRFARSHAGNRLLTFDPGKGPQDLLTKRQQAVEAYLAGYPEHVQGATLNNIVDRWKHWNAAIAAI